MLLHRFWTLSLLLGMAFSLASSPLYAQKGNYDANWIWQDVGNAFENAEAGTVWFRNVVRSGAPSTGALRMVSSSPYKVWVNGQLVGEAQGGTLDRYNLNGIVGRGSNIVAIEVTHGGGKAGLFVDGEVRSQGGSKDPFDSGANWVTTTTAPPKEWTGENFDVGSWKKAKVLGKHADSPWANIELKDTYLDRFFLAQGYELKRIGEPELVGSLVAMTWGNNGRLIASVERGPIISVTDENNDGVYDKVGTYSDQIKNCQGLCTVHDDLYAVGQGPEGVGVYRLPDANHDGVADELILIGKNKRGMGEHGPHDVVFGPDGWLYHNMGNHAWMDAEAQPESAAHDTYEGTLLQPKFEDANGHAAGIKNPGGTIWRFTPDGKKWWQEVAGFRNEYDVAFNKYGDLFTFDSDMEWDVGMPWYRPVRVNHCVPGAEFGWRSGSAKWPDYFFDALPTTVDIGRGSPTGVVFYEHNHFPKATQNSFFICDWSMGRIISVPLKKEGATYQGEWETIISGNPLNVSDIEVDRDGSLVFCVGGRGTEGGLYRVTYKGRQQKVATAGSVKKLLDLPQISAAWAREIAAGVKEHSGEAEWKAQLVEAAQSGTAEQKIRALTLLSQFGPAPEEKLLLSLINDSDAMVRSFVTLLLGNHSTRDVDLALQRLLHDEDPMVQRRACEAFLRAGLTPPGGLLVELLGSPDRFVRHAARVAIEKVPTAQWKEAVLGSVDTSVKTYGLLALWRVKGIAPEEIIVQCDQLLKNGRGGLTNRALVDSLRLASLALIEGVSGPKVESYTGKLLGLFPTGDAAIDTELARILAHQNIGAATPKLVEALVSEPSQQMQIRFALIISFLNNGWTLDVERKYLDWYEQTRSWEGGHSFVPYLANIVSSAVSKFSADDRKALVLEGVERPFAAALVLTTSKPDQVTDFDEVVTSILDQAEQGGSAGLRELVNVLISSLGSSKKQAARETLRAIYEKNPDRREELARVIARNPQKSDFDVLVRTLQFGDNTTLQLCLNALSKLESKPEKAEPVRLAILSGLKLQDQGGQVAVSLLKSWTGKEPENEKEVGKSLSFYQEVYEELYPEAPAAELQAGNAEEVGHDIAQLVAYLNNDERGKNGNADNGKLMFTKAKCVKCHRFLNEGTNVGPDLTSVRRRFQRKEIIESVLLPSQVISDQYRMVTVITDEGLVHNGMPVTDNTKPDSLVLLLNDATRIEIPKNSIDEQVASKISVMPVGLLKDLTREEIADLIAFLETSRFNEEQK